jgi:hypothetical protein
LPASPSKSFPEAKEYYEKFLDLWKDTDAGIVEVEDAKSGWLSCRGKKYLVKKQYN